MRLISFRVNFHSKRLKWSRQRKSFTKIVVGRIIRDIAKENRGRLFTGSVIKHSVVLLGLNLLLLQENLLLDHNNNLEVGM